jgi:two-component system chemotaxis response regulator CheY
MPGKKVLVVDDSASVRQQVGLALKQVGYEVIDGVDGVDGVEKVRKDASIGMVICDINMPRLNGLDMLEQVKSDTKFAKLPIVMLTSEDSPALVERAKKAGAKGWIIKPFRADLLVATVKKLMAA